MVKLTEKQVAVLNCLKENGGRLSVNAITEGTGFTLRAVNALLNDMSCYEAKPGRNRAGKGVIDIEKVDEGGEKPVRYVFLTDLGMSWTAPEEE